MLPDHGRCFRRAAARGGGLAAGGLEPPGSGLSLRALPSLAPRPRFCPKTQGVFIRLGCRAMEVARLLQNQRGNSFCKGRGRQEASEEEWGAGTEWKEGRGGGCVYHLTAVIISLVYAKLIMWYPFKCTV